MQNTIKILDKSVYGRILHYPNDDIAKKFAKLLGVKTFTDQHMIDIEALGYTITRSVSLNIED